MRERDAELRRRQERVLSQPRRSRTPAASSPTGPRCRWPTCARYLRRSAQVILDSLDPLAKLISRGTGLPHAEALSTQLLTSVDALHRTARHGPKVLADRSVGLPLLTRPKRASLVCEPLGVLGVRGSDEEPWSLPLQEVALALMCGNGVLLDAVLGERIRWVFDRAGVPEGVVCCVEPGALDGLDLKRVLEGPAAGKGPMLVLTDAPRHTVSGALWAGFATGGQSPSGVARLFVVREVGERMVQELTTGRSGCGSRRWHPRPIPPRWRSWSKRLSPTERCCSAGARGPTASGRRCSPG